jgi:hypothetical protein
MMKFTPAILFGLSSAHAFVMTAKFGRFVHNRGALCMSTEASSLPSLEQVRASSGLCFSAVRLFLFSESPNLTTIPLLHDDVAHVLFSYK